MWKLEFWKLEIKFGNRNFEDSFEDRIFKNKIIMLIIIIINQCENWNFGNWELNLEIENLRNYLKVENLKINKNNNNKNNND